MKDLLKKNSNAGTIAAVLLSGVALGAVAYLYFTDSGKTKRGQLKKKIKEKGKKLAADAVSKKTGISKKLVKKVADHVVK